MTVSLNQYRRTVRVFNNRKILLKKTHVRLLIIQKGLTAYLTSMTVNLNQYRRTVGVFDNRKILLKKTHGLSLQKIF